MIILCLICEYAVDLHTLCCNILCHVQVRRSNEIQQQIVEKFGNNQDPNMTILDKAKSAVQLCRTLLSNNPNKRYLGQSQGLKAAKSQPDTDDNKDNSASNIAEYSKNQNLDTYADKQGKKKQKKKGRARSYSDLTVSKSDIFEDEMAKIIMDAFPEILNDDANKGNDANENMYEKQNSEVIKIFELYHRYYVEVHLPREMELRKVRTKCEQKYNSLRYVSNKKELARREEDEIDWVMMEMKRAIDRLNKEGVLAPNEKPNKKGKGKKGKHHDKDDNNEPNHFKPPTNERRDSSTMIPVLAHRSTWSEASDTIFQLNVARQQQYQATKDLEESLKSREVVKSWYEEKVVSSY